MSDSEDFQLSGSESEDESEFEGAAVGEDDDEEEELGEAFVDEDEEDFAPKRSKKAKSAPKAGKAKSASSSTAAAKAKAKPKAKASPTKGGAGGGRAKGKQAAAASSKGTVKEKDAPKFVLEYMTQQNRPYSLINVYDNLHGAVKKTALGRVLDKLADEGKLKSKKYGKAVVYWPEQEQYADITEEMVSEKKDKVTELLKTQQDALAARKAADSRVASLKAMTSTPDLLAKVEEKEAEVAKLRERLAACEAAKEERESGAGDTPSAASAASRRPKFVRDKGKKELIVMLTKYAKAWKERKRMVVDLAGQIEEGANLAQKKVFDKAGVETDEEAGGPSLKEIQDKLRA